MLKRMQIWLGSRHPASIMGISSLFVALVGFVDHITGPELSFSIFYLVPIALVSWFGGRSLGSLMAFTCAIVWLFADLTSGHIYSNRVIPLCYAGVRLGFFIITGQLISLVRFSLEKQQDLARIDALTQVLNSRAFHEDGERLLVLSRRKGGPFSLAYIDLDNFKAVNDIRGHNEGDQLLQQVAGALRESLRGSDVVARLGGDEFALLLQDADIKGSRETIGRVRERL